MLNTNLDVPNAPSVTRLCSESMSEVAMSIDSKLEAIIDQLGSHLPVLQHTA